MSGRKGVKRKITDFFLLQDDKAHHGEEKTEEENIPGTSAVETQENKEGENIPDPAMESQQNKGENSKLDQMVK